MRTATTQDMLDRLKSLLAEPAPVRSKRGCWTQQLLAEELTQEGFPCSAFSVGQGIRLVKFGRSTGFE